MSTISRAELHEELLRWEEGLDARLQELRAEVKEIKHALAAVVRHLEAFELPPANEGE